MAPSPRPSRRSRAVTARWWFHHPLQAAYEALSPTESTVLRLPLLDPLLTEPVLDRAWPLDLLATPAQRMRALRPHLSRSVVLTGAAAWWVHMGGPCPSQAEVTSPQRDGGGPYTRARRAVLPAQDVVRIAGRSCTTLERTVVDLARTQPPRLAVEAVLAARAHGVSRVALLAVLERCRGGSGVGRGRAARIIDGVYAPPPADQPVEPQDGARERGPAPASRRPLE